MPRNLPLKPEAVRRLRARHPWILPGDIGGGRHRLAAVDPVDLVDGDGRFVARGVYCEGSPIPVRVFTFHDEPLDRDFFRGRLEEAAARRRPLLDAGTNSVRLVFSEADGLPGLVVDRYADVLVLQLNNRGIDLYRELIVGLLVELFQPRAVVLSNDGSQLAAEGMQPESAVLHGPLDGPVEASEGGVRFLVDPLAGQKTGLFLDQRENRLRLAGWCVGRRMHDVFAYAGAWGLHALAAGAEHVTFVDSSAGAARQIEANLRLNGFAADRAEIVVADAFDWLRALPREAADVLVLDPPAFAKSRREVAGAQRGYVDINRVGLRRLRRGGLLATSSCSYHVGPDLFADCVTRAVRQSARRVVLRGYGMQAADHPVLVNIPETHYLKTLFLEVL
ncbi:MAG: class I SAM-dependent rRNA methyltransferase [Candidatus Krumholzibacteriia bacterium]